MGKRRRNRWFPGAALIIMLGLGMLAGCGGTRDAAQALEELLAREYEVYYLFCSQGLPVDSSPEVAVEQDGVRYQPSVSEEYRSLSDLEALVDATYGEETAAAYLAMEDTAGAPLFVEIDGRLYQSAEGDLRLPRFEVREDTIQLEEETEDRAVFTMEEDCLDGSLYQCTVVLLNTDRGWRLETDAENRQRTLLREGTDEETVIPEDAAARETAESFLKALMSADVEEIEYLTQAAAGTYSSWKEIQIESAAVSETVEEGEGYGTYLAALSVADGRGILPDGESTYRITVGLGGEYNRMAVLTFRPEESVPYSLLPYEERSDAACEAVAEWIDLFGLYAFESPDQLPREMVAEYCLNLLSRDRGFEELMEGISPEELADAALGWFGLENFEARDTDFYLPQMDAYAAGGRQAFDGDYLVIGSREEEDGTILVEARTYRDPLRTQTEKIYTCAMAEEAEGVCRFLWAKVE